MVSISPRTFLNASLHISYKRGKVLVLSVQRGNWNYIVTTFGGRLDGWARKPIPRFVSVPTGPGNMIPRKIAIALWHAALSEGLLDPDLPDTPPP
jgi:hypothetical protein